MRPNLVVCLLLASLLSSFPLPSSAQPTHFNVTVPSDGADNDRFGVSTAISGSLMVVGAYQDDAPLADQGSASVFNCASFPCTQIAKLTASDGAAGDRFGLSVGISGTRVVVGARFADSTSPIVTNHGAAYLFDCGPTSCTQLTKIVASNYASSDLFGHSVAISGDLVASGALLANEDQGSVYVYSCPSSSPCAEIAELAVPSSVFFGIAIALDGGWLVAGDSAASSQGRAYLFECTSTSCVQGATLAASDPRNGSSFGASVAISGQLVVVGASGAAYVYECSSSSSCAQRDKLIPSDSAPGDSFGSSITISGSVIALGASGAAAAAGAVYLYDCWSFPCTFLTKMVASDAAPLDSLGSSVAMLGWRVAAGSFGDTVGVVMSGSVKWFDPTSAICNCPSTGNCGSDRACICKSGWTGLNCEIDQDECSLGTHSCHPNATCSNTIGSYTCACLPGYGGNGVICTGCPVGCSTCNNGQPGGCTSCVTDRWVLDAGNCFERCSKTNSYVRNGICYDCHPTCATCTGPSAFECSSCSAPQTLFSSCQ